MSKWLNKQRKMCCENLNINDLKKDLFFFKKKLDY